MACGVEKNGCAIAFWGDFCMCRWMRWRHNIIWMRNSCVIFGWLPSQQLLCLLRVCSYFIHVKQNQKTKYFISKSATYKRCDFPLTHSENIYTHKHTNQIQQSKIAYKIWICVSDIHVLFSHVSNFPLGVSFSSDWISLIETKWECILTNNGHTNANFIIMTTFLPKIETCK